MMMRVASSNDRNQQQPAAPSSPRPRVERKRIAGIDVTLSWPPPSSSSSSGDGESSNNDNDPILIKGITFLLPGAMVSISEYNSLRNVILQQDHMVASLYMNVLWPPVNNHRTHARNAKKVFDGLLIMYEKVLSTIDSYSVVGHSCGAKVALLLASIIDPARVKAVLALDPVDMNPVEFSKIKGSNLPLSDNDVDIEGEEMLLCSEDDDNTSDNCDTSNGSDVVHVRKVEESDAIASKNKNNHSKNKANQKQPHNIPIILTCTDGGLGISKLHDAQAIHTQHPHTTYIRHEGAGHMAYCDNGGGWAAKHIMSDVGSKEGNELAREGARELIRQILV